jgi:hypothetical protein
MMRSYLEQSRISDFETLNYDRRRYEVAALRRAELYRLQRGKNQKLYRQIRKTYLHTNAYIHLTHDERRAFIREVAERLSIWEFARLFAECVDKVFFNPMRAKMDDQAFEQVVSRFERFLKNIGSRAQHEARGLLIHDNNETVAKKHTKTMKRFHRQGTVWIAVDHIYETPLFVDSQLTSMVQVSDLCGYALRRYLENGEEELFDLVFSRADRYYDTVVGVRHYADNGCTCKICTAHRRTGPLSTPTLI